MICSYNLYRFILTPFIDLDGKCVTSTIFRPRITKKTCVFFLPSARIELLPIFEKTSVDKKTFKKKPSSFHEIKKTFSQLCFVLLVFSPPSLILFKIGQKFFYFAALINFSRNLSNVFFFWGPKIGINVFLPPSLIRFWLFSDLKQRNKKNSGLRIH